MAACGLLAGPWFALVLAWSASSWPGYRHALHAPALLGARGVAGATAFDLLGFVAAGLLAALALQALHAALRADGAGAVARIGATTMLLSALAFAAQGVWPLDPSQPLDAGPSRLHVAAWNLWWLAAVPGALLTAVGVRTMPRWRGLLPAGLLMAALLPLALASGLGGIGEGWRQRLALAAWFGWIAWAGWRVLRRPQP